MLREQDYGNGKLKNGAIGNSQERQVAQRCCLILCLRNKHRTALCSCKNVSVVLHGKENKVLKKVKLSFSLVQLFSSGFLALKLLKHSVPCSRVSAGGSWVVLDAAEWKPSMWKQFQPQAALAPRISKRFLGAAELLGHSWCTLSFDHCHTAAVEEQSGFKKSEV